MLQTAPVTSLLQRQPGSRRDLPWLETALVKRLRPQCQVRSLLQRRLSSRDLLRSETVVH